MEKKIKLEKINKALKKTFPGSKINKNIVNLKIGSLKKWDSLGNLNLILEIEKEFSLKFDSNTFSKIKSIQDILKENCSEMRLVRFDESENSCEFIYLVNFFDFNRMNQCRKQLKELGALNVSFLEKSN